MAGEWQNRTLAELIHIKHGYAFKGKELSTDTPSKFVAITPGNFHIGGGYKGHKLKYFSGTVPESYVLQPGQVVVTMTDLSKEGDTLGYAAIIPKNINYTILHNQRIGLVEVKKPNLIDKDFLHWLMRSPPYRHEVLASHTGSTVKHTSPTKICKYTFNCPPLAEQKHIAHLLGSLDDKIELNRKMNETLEEMAQAIFKSWFIDFDGVPTEDLVDSELGLIPKGWEVRSIYDVTEVHYGAPFKSKLFNEDKIGKPLIRIRDLKSHSPSKYTTEIHKKGRNIKAGDIIFGMDAEFRATVWLGEDSWLNQRMGQLIPKAPYSCSFIYFAIKPVFDFYERAKTGTTVIHLGKKDIDKAKLLYPTPQLVTKFADATTTLFDRIVSNHKQSQTLSELRDTLLPKLISGEIRIPEAEEQVEQQLSLFSEEGAT